MNIGDKIRKVRELKNLKQEYVAQQLGMSVTAYGNIERNDSSITIEKLEEIAAALDVRPEDILNMPEHLNIESIVNSHSGGVGVGFGISYHDNRKAEADSGEILAYKQAIENAQKEIEYLRQQNIKLMELLQNRT